MLLCLILQRSITIAPMSSPTNEHRASIQSKSSKMQAMINFTYRTLNYEAPSKTGRQQITKVRLGRKISGLIYIDGSSSDSSNPSFRAAKESMQNLIQKWTVGNSINSEKFTSDFKLSSTENSTKADYIQYNPRIGGFSKKNSEAKPSLSKRKPVDSKITLPRY